MSRERDVPERRPRVPRSGIGQRQECRRVYEHVCFALRGRIPTGAPCAALQARLAAFGGKVRPAAIAVRRRRMVVRMAIRNAHMEMAFSDLVTGARA